MPCLAIPSQLWASLEWVLQVMYAEPMGSKTPNSRSPQSGMRMDHHTLSDDGEEVLQPSPPVPGTSDECKSDLCLHASMSNTSSFLLCLASRLAVTLCNSLVYQSELVVAASLGHNMVTPGCRVG